MANINFTDTIEKKTEVFSGQAIKSRLRKDIEDSLTQSLREEEEEERERERERC